MSNVISVQIKRVEGSPEVPLPVQMSVGSSGYDLHASLNEAMELAPGARALVPTGFAISMPVGLEAQIRPRSGLAFKYGITCLNTPGTIDADYRGEIKVLLINLGDKPFLIHPGERIAQMVFQLVPSTVLVEVQELDDTVRGAGGFGHTGTKAANEAQGIVVSSQVE